MRPFKTVWAAVGRRWLRQTHPLPSHPPHLRPRPSRSPRPNITTTTTTTTTNTTVRQPANRNRVSSATATTTTTAARRSWRLERRRRRPFRPSRRETAIRTAPASTTATLKIQTLRKSIPGWNASISVKVSGKPQLISVQQNRVRIARTRVVGLLQLITWVVIKSLPVPTWGRGRAIHRHPILRLPKIIKSPNGHRERESPLTFV